MYAGGILQVANQPQPRYSRVFDPFFDLSPLNIIFALHSTVR
jgi:hypothetical protein